jgi:hypothetical protein
MVYGTKVIFPTQPDLPVLKFMQEELEDPRDIQRIIFQIIEVEQNRERLHKEAVIYQTKVKENFDKKNKKDIFQEGDLVLRWDARREDKSKHGKFENLWYGPFRIAKVMNNNTFLLHNLDDSEILGGPMNGWFLKHYFFKPTRGFQFVQYDLIFFLV